MLTAAKTSTCYLIRFISSCPCLSELWHSLPVWAFISIIRMITQRIKRISFHLSQIHRSFVSIRNDDATCNQERLSLSVSPPPGGDHGRFVSGILTRCFRVWTVGNFTPEKNQTTCMDNVRWGWHCCLIGPKTAWYSVHVRKLPKPVWLADDRALRASR